MPEVEVKVPQQETSAGQQPPAPEKKLPAKKRNPRKTRNMIIALVVVAALAVGAVSDLIGATLFPFGAFFPGFTVTAGLVGLIYGLFLHQKGEGFHGRALWLRVVGASLCASLTRLVLNSVWLYIMYGKGLFGMLPARFTETICMVAAQILLIPVLLSLSRQLTRRGAFPA